MLSAYYAPGMGIKKPNMASDDHSELLGEEWFFKSENLVHLIEQFKVTSLSTHCNGIVSYFECFQTHSWKAK